MSGITRIAKAIWKGTGKEGKGVLTSATGVLKDTPYNFHSRFENGPETNPEELLAAAHAGCFAMALSFGLNKAGFTADELSVDCGVTVSPAEGGGFEITKSALKLVAKIPGISKDQFIELANGAKAGCPVSKLYKTEITLDATLV
jgi:lipoyl-dependent peroxiredoxin